jgi:hypothetical protein
MKEYKIDKSNKIIIKQGNIEEEKGDAIVCWVAYNLKAGPESFYKIHKKAGAQVLSSITLLEPVVKECSAFTTMPGLLEFYVIVHSVLPFKPAMFNESFFYIIKTLATFKERNICRDAYFTFPGTDKKMFIENLLIYSYMLENFSFIWMIETKEEYNTTIKTMDKLLKKKWWNF